MAVTRSTAADRKTAPPLIRPRNPRSFELIALFVASLLSLAGISLTYLAKTTEVTPQTPLMLSDLARAEQLIPHLQLLATPRDRQVAAREIYNLVQSHGGRLPNVGAIGRIRTQSGQPLLSQGQVARLKPLVAVRTLG